MCFNMMPNMVGYSSPSASPLFLHCAQRQTFPQSDHTNFVTKCKNSQKKKNQNIEKFRNRSVHFPSWKLTPSPWSLPTHKTILNLWNSQHKKKSCQFVTSVRFQLLPPLHTVLSILPTWQAKSKSSEPFDVPFIYLEKSFTSANTLFQSNGTTPL